MSVYNRYVEIAMTVPESRLNPANESSNPLIQEIQERLIAIMIESLKDLPPIKRQYAELHIAGLKLREIAAITSRSPSNICHAIKGEFSERGMKPGVVQHLRKILTHNPEVLMLLEWIRIEKESYD
ncbi:MAG TPA: hypothetical protein VJ327_11230 [Patescibacteria group bacterium]|nr:hypothetical protein [Patescibacteria group bacterium]